MPATEATFGRSPLPPSKPAALAEASASGPSSLASKSGRAVQLFLKVGNRLVETFAKRHLGFPTEQFPRLGYVRLSLTRVVRRKRLQNDPGVAPQLRQQLV